MDNHGALGRSASRATVKMFTQSPALNLARDEPDGTRVNALAIPAVFLASGTASFVDGVTFAVNGGTLAV